MKLIVILKALVALFHVKIFKNSKPCVIYSEEMLKSHFHLQLNYFEASLDMLIKV